MTSTDTVAGLLTNEGLVAAAALLSDPARELASATRERMQRAQQCMRQFSVRGVPALVVDSGNRMSLIDHASSYGKP